jgi:DNA-binding transcriptional regulator YbjK
MTEKHDHPPTDDPALPSGARARRPKRIDGKARREEIIKAAQRLIAREGVRAVRHRSVASEAGVPLSATTYYFRDIHELIAETFFDFAESGASETGHLTQAVAATLARFLDGSQSLQDRQILLNAILVTLLNHIDRQVQNRDQRLIEQSFRLEALHNPVLRQAQQENHRTTLTTTTALLRTLGSGKPELDAELIYSTVLYLEYQRVLAGDSLASREHSAEVLRCLLEKLV